MNAYTFLKQISHEDLLKAVKTIVATINDPTCCNIADELEVIKMLSKMDIPENIQDLIVMNTLYKDDSELLREAALNAIDHWKNEYFIPHLDLFLERAKRKENKTDWDIKLINRAFDINNWLIEKESFKQKKDSLNENSN